MSQLLKKFLSFHRTQKFIGECAFGHYAQLVETNPFSHPIT